jgi:hypothetical protein
MIRGSVIVSLTLIGTVLLAVAVAGPVSSPSLWTYSETSFPLPVPQYALQVQWLGFGFFYRSPESHFKTKLPSKRDIRWWLRCVDMDHPGPRGNPYRVWSMRFPIAPPLLLASAFLSYPIAAYIKGPYRRRRRRSRGDCLHCGYSLTGNTSGTCPECGAPCAS